MKLLERGRDILGRITGASPQAGDTPGPLVTRTTAAFMRGGVSTILGNWLPSLRNTQDDVQASWTMATARATDAIQNSGWITGGVRSAVGGIMGTGLRLSATPDTTLVKFEGLTAENGEAIDADGWSRFVERRFEQWANDPWECDMLGRQTLGQLAESALKSWFATGEIVSILPWRRLPGAMTGTKVLNLPPHKLSQKNDTRNRIIQGVQNDSDGRPYAYIFRMKDPNTGLERDTPVLARDGAFRPQVIHLFEGLPGQVRGITPLVAALQVVRQYDQLANATLTAALIQAIFAATIESETPTADLMNAIQTADSQGVGGNLDSFMQMRMGWASNTTIDLNEQSKIAHLFPGESLKFNRSEHPNGTYEAFVKVLLREIAKCMGVTVEQLTGDYSGVTYTGVRMSTTDNWQTTLMRRVMIARWYQIIYEAWLEEEIEAGRILFPDGLAGFLRLRPAAVRAAWRGPAKPQPDDLKSAKAHETYRALGVMSDTMIADDLGVRIEDVYESRRREALLREKFGLDDTGPSTMKSVAEIQAEAAKANVAEDPGPGEDDTEPEPQRRAA